MKASAPPLQRKHGIRCPIRITPQTGAHEPNHLRVGADPRSRDPARRAGLARLCRGPAHPPRRHGKGSAPAAAFAVVRDGDRSSGRKQSVGPTAPGTGARRRTRHSSSRRSTRRSRRRSPPCSRASIASTSTGRSTSTCARLRSRVRSSTPATSPSGSSTRTPAVSRRSTSAATLVGHATQCHMPNADEMIRDYGIVVGEPGEHFDYSNLGFIVASEAVARAAHRPLRALIRDEVLLPLGMKHSSLGLDSAMARDAVVPFVYGQGLVPPSRRRRARRTTQLQRMGECARPGAVRRLPHEGASARPARHPLRRRHRLDADRHGRDRIGHATVRARLVDRGSLRLSHRPVAGRQLGRAGVAPTRSVGACRRRGPREQGCRVRRRGHRRGSRRRAAEVRRVDEGERGCRRHAADRCRPRRRASLDSTMVGAWAGTCAPRAATSACSSPSRRAAASRRASASEATPASRARRDRDASRLTMRFPGDLEAPNPAGMNRETRLYLDRRGARFGGVITTRPPSASGLDGSVSYWLEIAPR